MFENYININKNKLINSICDLISIPSVSIESESSKYPFGKDCNDALLYFLSLADKLGFKAKNIDGYCRVC